MPDSVMNSKILRYPLDLTGVSTDNFIEAEVKTLPTGKNRAIVLSTGAFYTDSLKVWDHTTGKLLDKKIHYYAVQLVPSATARSGKEVCSVIVITDPSVSDKVRINYQCLGGPYTLNVEALEEMLKTIDIDERPITWGSIIGKPDLFPPGHHLHDIGDVYGFEYVVIVLEEIRKAILMGDVASHDEIMNYVKQVEDDLSQLIRAVDDSLTNHIENKGNPHETTKAQVGLGNVENYPPATGPTAIAGTNNNQYLTPFLLKTVLDHYLANIYDPRYVQKGAAVESSIKTENGKAFVFINGSWRQFYPPQWQ